VTHDLRKRAIGILKENSQETGEPYQYAVEEFLVGEGAMIARVTQDGKSFASEIRHRTNGKVSLQHPIWL